MKNKGVTLIELMIVIAIMGIVLPFISFKETFKEYEIQQKTVQEQFKVLQFKKMFFKLLKGTKSFSKVNSRQIFTDNFRLTVSNNKSRLSLNGKKFTFDKFEIYNFSKINDSLVTCTIKNGNSNYDIYLVAGNYSSNTPQKDKPVDIQSNDDLSTKQPEQEVINEE